MTNSRDDLMALATALKNANWPNVSIGNKALLRKAIECLTEVAQRPATQVVDREVVAWRIRKADGGYTRWFDGKPPGHGGRYEVAYTHPPKSPDISAEEMREALLDATANLVGAASAYRKHAARHRSIGRAIADPFFTTRAVDLEKAAERAQAAIRQLPTSKD